MDFVLLSLSQLSSTIDLVLLFLLLVIGIIIIIVIVKILLFILPAAIIAIVVWLLTGSFFWAGVAFVVVALISLLKH
ncbi:MAG: hypothetical protein ACPLZC_06660 [Candidatus Bathyarchaeales archaeon]